MLLAIGYVVAALVPRRADRALVRWLGSLALALRRGSVRRFAAELDAALGPLPEEQSLARARACYRLRFESAWGRARGLHRNGWAPELELEGLEHLDAALTEGRGVILWRMQFCSSPLAVRALWMADRAPVHLGAPGHGTASKGRIGLKLLEPLIRRSEDWYLAERVMIRHRQSVSYAKTLMARLGDNRIVSIFGDLWGMNAVDAPFFHGHAVFATGAPSLAWRTGAVLLTMFVVRDGAFRYRAVIEGPIETERDLGRKEFVRESIAEFAARLERTVVAHPESWANWGEYLGRHGPFARADAAPSTRG